MSNCNHPKFKSLVLDNLKILIIFVLSFYMNMISAAPYQIKGDLTGVGSPVVINGVAGLITNAHVLGKTKKIKVTLLNHKASNFKIVFKWDLADLAFIVPNPSDLITQNILKKETYAIFNPNKSVEYKNFKNKDNLIMTFYKDGPKEISHNSHVQPNLVNDFIISGEYDEVYYLPFYARPGQSGSPFIENGRFSGILTKVTLGIFPESYAIPVIELDKLLQEYFFKSKAPLFESRLFIGPNGERLYITPNGDKIVVTGRQGIDNIGGGDIGNGGGGDIGNGGNRGKKDIWKLNTKFLSKTYSYEVASPLNDNKSSITYNGFEVDYIIKEYKGAYAFMTPYLSLLTTKKLNNPGKIYLGYKNFGQDYGGKVGHLSGRELLEHLREERLSQSLPKYGRLYLRIGESQFDLINTKINTPLGDHAQALSSEFLNFPPNTQGAIKDIGDYTLDSENRYSKQSPFMAKYSKKNFLDIITAPLAHFEHGKKWEKRPIEKFHFIINKDLNKILIKDLKNYENIILNKIDSRSVSKIHYESKDKKYKAVLLYNNLQLVLVDRLLLLSPHYLYEFISCKIGEFTCVR